MEKDEREGPVEIALVGDLSDKQTELCEKLLDVPPGGECVLYIDSQGGSPYTGIALTSLILLRDLAAVGVVAGECSSAALWPLAGELRDPLLLIHGLSDDNVHFRNTSRMIEALVSEGRRFEVMVYPGESHGVSSPAARRHVFNEITATILEHLGAP